MSEKQKPSIGRIVHYVQEKPAQFGTGVLHLPAIITAVWGDACVNLHVFSDGSNSEPDSTNYPRTKWITSTNLDESESPAARTWHWPERI